MANEYNTLARDGYFELTEKHSRFIGNCRAVSSEEEAAEYINFIKQQYRDASHNVYAYNLREGNLSRCTDDGEPSGTAGRQLLSSLTGPQIFDAVVVVTRYFGGTLLGTGGLSRAYAQTASGTVQNAGIAVMTECSIFSLGCAYSLYDTLIFLLESAGVQIIGTEYAEMIRITAKCRKTDFEAVRTALAEKTSGRVEPQLLRDVFEPF